MPLAPLVTGVRWAALVIAVVVAAMRSQHSLAMAAAALAVGAIALWQTRRSRRSGGGQRRAVIERPMIAVVEVAVAAAAVATTGSWDSPFVFCLLGAVMAAGFVRGFPTALSLAVASAVAVSVSYGIQLGGVPSYSLQTGGQWALELVLVAVLAGYTRRIFGEAEERHTQALDRMSQLSEANELLVSLHRVAQSLPASLDLNQVLASTLTRLRSLIECDVLGILVCDEATMAWTMAASEGAALPGTLTDDQLPGPLRAATASSVASLVVSLGPSEGIGPDILARSGLYAPLRARGALIGLVALEHHEPGFYGRQDLRLLDGFIESAALAIDNARWFNRLRTIGADEERTRIARDMHDSVGQSLAYVAFKLDRLTSMAEGQALRQELDILRTEVRGVLTEVRDTLCDLRTDVTDRCDLVETLQAFLERVGERADFEVSFLHESSGRLPVVQERELWRIAHEAITNVERHAGARHLRVRWECDGRHGRLTIADDGRGFAPSRAAQADAYGLRGMRERADAIGARLEIESEPYVGTMIECQLPGADPPAHARTDAMEAA
ncbi:MAG: GAF domain-containing sensor histidine kinase [Actinomycetota bacterium]|nr:GAF domain-containing sensor histidine kinase [Actinomycetota bacterium]